MKAGEKYGRWTAVRFSRSKIYPCGSAKHMWIFKCECGNESEEQAGNISSGRSNSCGCLRVEGVKIRFTVHGESAKKTRMYGIWKSMHQRCKNPRHPRWMDWGGRGIKICPRWDVYENFKQDMSSGYSDALSIDRINNDGDYEPSNCRWATAKQQAQNSRPKRKRIT